MGLGRDNFSYKFKDLQVVLIKTSVALARESSGYVWSRAQNGLVHILLVTRLGCFYVTAILSYGELMLRLRLGLI